MHPLTYGVFGAAFALVLATPAMADHIALNGNGLPHINYSEKFLLNLHAYDNCPPNDFDGSERHVIALQADFGDFDGAADRHPDLLRTNDILLTAGVLGEFHVIDGNACNEDPAVFVLPPDVSTEWEAYFRLVGQPGTGFDIATCGTIDNDIVCGGALVRVREANKPHFEDVTRELLTVDGALLFTDVSDPFWEAFTQGQAKAQIVFVPAAN